jgi:hypothetical protein
MGLAFATAALAAGVVGSALTTLLAWVATVVAGSDGAWTVAPWLGVGVGALVAVATYGAEVVVHRRTMARMRSTGEPWAYRQRR